MAITGATSQVYCPLSFGDYTVLVTGNGVCLPVVSNSFHSDVDFVDNCPQIHKNFGTKCADGNANTINDRVRNDCKCCGDYSSPFITVNCPKDTTVITTSKYGTVITWDEYGMFSSSSDACKGIVDVKRTSGYYSGYPIEPSALIFEEYIATDKCGNKSSCSFFIKTTDPPATEIGGGAGNSSNNLLKINTVTPNPAHDQLNISLSSENETTTELRVINTLGQSVITEKHFMNKGINDIQLDVSNLQNGFYFIYSSQNPAQAPVKFVKN